MLALILPTLKKTSSGKLMVTFLHSVFVVIGSTIRATSRRESHADRAWGTPARRDACHHTGAHGTSPRLANGARLSSVLDPRRPKRADSFHLKNHILPRHPWPERNAMKD